MISVRGLRKSFGSTVVFQDAHAVFPSGTITFLMGPNGSGKTTLLRCLLGLTCYSGEISVDGVSFDPSRQRTYPVFDDVPFYPSLSGAQNLRILFPEAHVAASPYLSEELLRRRVKRYSYGERKRLALAGSLSSPTTTLFLDEPTNGALRT